MQPHAWNFCHDRADEYKLHRAIRNAFTLTDLTAVFA